MTKVEALKQLAAAFGIDGVDGDTISKVISSIAENYEAPNPAPKEIVMSSSTPDSTKKFKITVVDAGTISAAEITE